MRFVYHADDNLPTYLLTYIHLSIYTMWSVMNLQKDDYPGNIRTR